MEPGLSGKVALVTGSSRGIGMSIAMALAKEGAIVNLCGRNEGLLAEAQRNIGRVCGSSVFYYVVDARNADSIQLLFDKFGKLFTQLDVLVNNVGGPLKFGKFEELTDDDWLGDWSFNFMSAVRFTRQALPLLKASGNGRIINISSVPAKQPGAFNPHYSASKAALENLTKYLANDLAQYNILVNAIRPNTLEGGLWAENVADRAKRDGVSEEEAAAKIRASTFKKSPLQRMGTPEDVANMVAFLASDRAKFITGSVINVDGGTVRSV